MADWEFELEDLEESASAGPEREEIDPENAAFVLLGVLLAVGVLLLLVP